MATGGPGKGREPQRGRGQRHGATPPRGGARGHDEHWQRSPREGPNERRRDGAHQGQQPAGAWQGQQPAGAWQGQQPAGAWQGQQPAGAWRQPAGARQQPAGAWQVQQPAGAWQGQQPAGARQREQGAGAQQPAGAWQGQQPGGARQRQQGAGGQQHGGARQREQGAGGQQHGGAWQREQGAGGQQHGGAWQREQGAGGQQRQQGPGEHQYGGARQRQQGADWQQPRGIGTGGTYSASSGTSRHRPGTGTSAPARLEKPTFTIPGPISLLTNYFEITLSDKPIYHYDVDIRLKNEAEAPSDSNKRTLSCRVNRMVIEQLASKELNGCAHAFDGKKNLYTSEKLLKHELTLTVHLDDKSDRGGFSVALKFTSAITPKETEKRIQALDIIIRHAASVSHTPVGRSFFKPPKDPNGHQNLYTLLSGFYTSVRCCQLRPMLNIDLSAAYFYNPMPLLRFIRMAINVDANRAENVVSAHNRLSLELRGLQVSTVHRGYKRFYRVIKVTDCSAKAVTLNDVNELPPETESSPTEEFNVRKKTNVKVTEHGRPNEGPKTVAELFETKYPGYMKDSNLPCVQCEGKKSKQDLPLDICSIEAQPYNRKLDGKMKKDMVDFVNKNPQRRFDCIKEWAQQLLSMGQKRLEGFTMKFLIEPANVEGHILSPPSIHFRKRTPRVQNGAWPIGLRDRFFTIEHVIPCGVLAVGIEETERGVIDETARLLEEGCRNHGLRLSVEPAQFVANNDFRRQIISHLKQLKISEGAKHAKRIVLVVVGMESLYATVKSVADVDVGILTQCVLLTTLKAAKDAKDSPKEGMILTNICLKINAKLGGCNNKLGDAMFKKNLQDTLIIGIDVNHPAPGDTETPSFAGCVASMDVDAVQYSARAAVQIAEQAAVGRKEVVTNLQDMVRQLLKSYKSYNGGVRPLPKRIIVYRDGVSEGQFAIVLQQELCAIRSACKTVGNYAPKVTFIVVQKRHHTRFQLSEENWATYNIPPGTTVDTVVTHPDHVNFFLCSHAGLKGTSRPAHYHVLHDDTELSAERLQQLKQLSYFLCHLVARCARSVSIPAPVYYAHLAAYRAKVHIQGAPPTNSHSVEHYQNLVKVHNHIEDTMYFL